MGKIHENFITKIIKLLALPKAIKHIREIEKELDSPELKAEMEALKYSNEKVQAHLEDYCKKHPDSFHCNKNRKNKSKLKFIK